MVHKLIPYFCSPINAILVKLHCVCTCSRCSHFCDYITQNVVLGIALRFPVFQKHLKHYCYQFLQIYTKNVLPATFFKLVMIINENSLSRPTKPVTSIAEDIKETISLLKTGLCVLKSYHVDICWRCTVVLQYKGLRMQKINV